MGTRRGARIAAWAVIAATLPLAGCGSVLTEGTGDAAGIAGAGIAGAVTKNATVGAAIGLGVRSVANFGLQIEERAVHRVEQDRIAAAAGPLPEGTAGVWSVSHQVPIEADQHGELVVTRILAARPTTGAAFTCKEIVFSVDRGKPLDPGKPDSMQARGFYTATVCLDGANWKWASAEPAVERWGSLQ